MEKSEQTLVTGIRKWLIYFRIAIHVALHFFVKAIRGKMPPLRYPAFLFRALVFLFALRHSKIVKLRSTYKIHLYIPAYPKPSFFYTLEKLYRNDPGPATVVLSMTRACSYNCPHCYQQKDSGQDLDMNLLIDAASAMQKLGVTMFDIEGGEPLARIDRLLELMNSLDYRAEIWINTTGAGLTDDMLTKLIDAKLAGVMVSLHTTDEDKFDKFTAVPGAFKTAKDAIRAFGSKGLFTAINFVPTPEMVQGNEVEDLFDLAKELNCSFVQVIHGKAAGGWLGDTKNTSTENTMIDKLKRLHLLYNSGKKPGYPSISAQVFEEDVNLFGCTSGGVDRFYMGADGEVQPCEFLNISFGNVNTEPFEVIFKRMRREFATPCSDWLCCTMATRIDDTIKEHGLTRTPIPWKITKDIIPDWNRGKPTKFYKKLGIYKGKTK